MTHSYIFHPFVVSMVVLVFYLVYCRFSGFTKTKWMIAVVIFLLIVFVQIIQRSYGPKNIGNWFERRNEYQTSYYIEIRDFYSHSPIYSKVKADVIRPVEKCIYTTYDAPDICTRQTFLKRVYLPDGSIAEYKNRGIEITSDFGNTKNGFPVPIPNSKGLWEVLLLNQKAE